MYHRTLGSTNIFEQNDLLATNSLGDLFAINSLAQKIVAAVDPFMDQIILDLSNVQAKWIVQQN